MRARIIPEVIQRYQQAHDRHDVDQALDAFAARAVVRDEDQEWSGTAAIRDWLIKTSTEYTFTRTLLGVEEGAAGTWEIRNRLEGNFPGGVVDLRYRFELAGDEIIGLTIAP